MSSSEVTVGNPAQLEKTYHAFLSEKFAKDGEVFQSQVGFGRMQAEKLRSYHDQAK